MSAKEFSVRIGFACFRYALGGRDEKYTINDCIRWLQLIAKEGSE